MEKFSDMQLAEAERSIISTLSKCEKILPKLKEGSSQHTLLMRRIEALTIAKALIQREMKTSE